MDGAIARPISIGWCGIDCSKGRPVLVISKYIWPWHLELPSPNDCALLYKPKDLVDKQIALDKQKARYLDPDDQCTLLSEKVCAGLDTISRIQQMDDIILEIKSRDFDADLRL
jgi:hypothetical protein